MGPTDIQNPDPELPTSIDKCPDGSYPDKDGNCGNQVHTFPGGTQQLNDCGGSTCGPGTHCQHDSYGDHCVQDNAGTDNTGAGTGSSVPNPLSYNIPRVAIPTSPNQSVYNFYAQRTPQELAYLSSITDLAKMLTGVGTEQWQIGMPAYAKAIKYWSDIIGGDKAAGQRAIAPQVNATTEAYTGAESQLRANPSLARSGVRGVQIAELARSKAASISGLLPKAMEGAAQAAANYGLSGAQAGSANVGAAAGLTGNLAANEMQNRNTAAQLELSNRYTGSGQQIQEMGQYLSAQLGFRGQDIQQMLGLAGIDLGYGQLALGQSQLAQQGSQFQQTYGFQQQYFNWYQQFQQQQLQQQQQQQKGGLWGGLAGLGARAIPTSTVAKGGLWAGLSTLLGLAA